MYNKKALRSILSALLPLLLFSLFSPVYVHAQSSLLLQSRAPYRAEERQLSVLWLNAFEDTGIPLVSSMMQINYGVWKNLDLQFGAALVHYLEEEGFDRSGPAFVEARAAYELERLFGTDGTWRLIPYAGARYYPADPYYVLYSGEMEDVRVQISPYGDPGWDIFFGSGIYTELPIRKHKLVIHSFAEYARTERNTFFPDSEFYKNRLNLNISPVLFFRETGAGNFTASIQNNVSLWLKRGMYYEICPQLVYNSHNRLGVSFGLHIPVISAPGLKYVLGIQYRIGAQNLEKRIELKDLHFPPDQFILLGPENEKSQNNERILRSAYRTLQRYPEHSIIIEGHTSFVYWNDPVKGPEEQRSVLIPLSRNRAEAVKKALVEMGIEADRITAVGKGGLEPRVPFDNPELQWKNRRVEIVLLPVQDTDL